MSGDVGNLFCVLICYLYIFFDEISLHIFCPFSHIFSCVFFKWLCFEDSFLCPKCELFFIYVVCKYFLSFWSMSFHSSGRIFNRTKYLILMKSIFCGCLLYRSWFWCHLRTICQDFVPKDFFPTMSSKSL